MIDTSEYYAGTYPEPHEIIDCEDEEEYDNYDLYMADVMHEERMLGD